MATLTFLCFFFIFNLSKFSSSTTITLPLSQIRPDPSDPSDPDPDPYKNLLKLSKSTLTRAHHLKNPQITTTTPLAGKSYGAYEISLSFGTPLQTIPFIFDTGSVFSWFPCTRSYVCKNCFNSSTIPTFRPKLSSTVKLVGCTNPKCGWIYNNNDTDVESRCRDCSSDLKNCKQLCPPYRLDYGLGFTGGYALLDTLSFPGKKVADFFVGCSVIGSNAPAGIVGFGRGDASLPSQLGINKFSYCLLSHKYDDTEKSSLLALDVGYSSSKKSGNVSYTPFLKNLVVPGRYNFGVYYYVALRKITIDGIRVKIPYKYLSPAPDGTGGTIVDSGTTFTYMNYNIFKLLSDEIIKQTKGYKREVETEKITNFRPCFSTPGKGNSSLPEMIFHFRGGAQMVLPLANYFSFVDENKVICLTVITDNESNPRLSGGPAILLGNFQMQNYYVEFDLRNERFGFRQQSCG